MIKYSLAAGIAWGTLAVSLSSPANAQAEATSQVPASAPQTGQTGAPGAVSSSTEAPANTGLEDIVVTAQRREQNLQSVPVAVTVLSGETLKARGIGDISSLTSVTPSLQYTSTTNIGVIFLRGVGTESLNLGDEPSVATYIDGVYYPSAYGGDLALPDVQRVEVLKGPQGTLFGRNAAGGVINITTRTPSQTPVLDASIGYGRFNTLDGSVYMSTGITPNLAVSLTGYYHDQQDGFGKNLTTGNDVFKNKTEFYRAKVLWTPTDTTTVTLGAFYNKSRGDLGVDRRPLPGTRAVGNTPYRGFYTIENTFDSLQQMFRKGGSLQVDQELGFARLVATGSIQSVRNKVLLDQDGTPLPNARFTSDPGNGNIAHTKTAELQLLAPSDSKLQWILGGFYYHDLASNRPITFINVFSRYISQKTDSYSAFGQATYPLLDSLRVTGGLRYTSDRRERFGYGLNGAGVINFPFKDEHKTFSKLTYRLSLDYDIANDVLAYASYNRGFKSGVYNTISLVEAPVNPEVIDAFEVGFKSQLADRRVRLNGAAFYYDHKDIQSSQFNGPQLTLINAAKGEIYGGELELEVAPTRELRLQAGGSYTHARYKDFVGAPQFTPLPAGGNSQAPGDATGNAIVRSPDFTFNASVNYERELGGGSHLYGNVSYYYNDGFFWKPDNRVKQGSYNLVNAKFGMRTADNVWDLSFWGKNIFSQQYYVYEDENTNGDEGSPAAPATYGVTIRMKFGG